MKAIVFEQEIGTGRAHIMDFGSPQELHSFESDRLTESSQAFSVDQLRDEALHLRKWLRSAEEERRVAERKLRHALKMLAIADRLSR